MAPSKAAAVSAAVLEAPTRSARAGVVVAELLDELSLAAAHAARASLHLRFGGQTRASACSSAQKEPSWSCDFLLIVLSSFRSLWVEVRMEGVEPSWPLDRRLLRPVRIPVPPHQQKEPQARAAERAARRSRGRPRGLPLGSCRVESRLAAGLELYDLGRARHWLGPCRDAYEVEVHLRSSLCSKGARGALVLRGRRGRSRR